MSAIHKNQPPVPKRQNVPLAGGSNSCSEHTDDSTVSHPPRSSSGSERGVSPSPCVESASGPSSGRPTPTKEHRSHSAHNLHHAPPGIRASSPRHPSNDISVQNHPPALTPITKPPRKLFTRPATLPPKCQHEEERHIQAYRDMMAASIAKTEKQRKLQEQYRYQREQRTLELTRQWKKIDLTDFPKRRNEKFIRDLVFEGIPPNIRGKVWPLAVGNTLHITPQLYEIYKDRAIQARTKEEGESLGREGSVGLIPVDLHRTFPWLNIFQVGGPYYDFLREVLEAFVCYRPDIGYVQGMSFVAAVFLLYLDPFEAFLCLANVLNQPFFLTFYRMEAGEIQTLLGVLSALLEEHVPAVHAHFQKHGVALDVFALDWILTIYSKSLPLDLTSRIWDNFFWGGDAKYLFRVALGILTLLQKELLENEFEGCVMLMGKLPRDLNGDKLFQIISGIKISKKRWDSLLQFEMRTASIAASDAKI
mmetsp:Transcript_21748/g.61126  ORF Transcript_21748/g.61126 Transcript_21748/m.61126 type:complete len:477 (+) Transcript_21748:84-1514(+)